MNGCVISTERTPSVVSSTERIPFIVISTEPIPFIVISTERSERRNLVAKRFLDYASLRSK